MRIARIWTEVCRTSGSRSASRSNRTTAHRLSGTHVGQVDVHPPGEQILRIPVALPVTEQHQRRHALRVLSAVAGMSWVDVGSVTEMTQPLTSRS